MATESPHYLTDVVGKPFPRLSTSLYFIMLIDCWDGEIVPLRRSEATYLRGPPFILSSKLYQLLRSIGGRRFGVTKRNWIASSNCVDKFCLICDLGCVRKRSSRNPQMLRPLPTVVIALVMALIASFRSCKFDSSNNSVIVVDPQSITYGGRVYRSPVSEMRESANSKRSSCWPVVGASGSGAGHLAERVHESGPPNPSLTKHIELERRLVGPQLGAAKASALRGQVSSHRLQS